MSTGPQDPLQQVIDFIQQLDEAKVWYRLESVRDAVMVVASTPGTRWEVEFFSDGRVEVERFKSDGTIEGKEALTSLFREAA